MGGGKHSSQYRNYWKPHYHSLPCRSLIYLYSLKLLEVYLWSKLHNLWHSFPQKVLILLIFILPFSELLLETLFSLTLSFWQLPFQLHLRMLILVAFFSLLLFYQAFYFNQPFNQKHYPSSILAQELWLVLVKPSFMVSRVDYRKHCQLFVANLVNYA